MDATTASAAPVGAPPVARYPAAEKAPGLFRIWLDHFPRGPELAALTLTLGLMSAALALPAAVVSYVFAAFMLLCPARLAPELAPRELWGMRLRGMFTLLGFAVAALVVFPLTAALCGIYAALVLGWPAWALPGLSLPARIGATALWIPLWFSLVALLRAMGELKRRRTASGA